MGRLQRYEKVVLAGTIGFVLFAGGWFLARSSTPEPYQVTTARQEEAPLPAQSAAQSGEERPDSLLEGEVIDLNTADEYDLQRLPGIGEKRAQAIVAYRAEHGPFQSVDELDRVEGIGEGILAGLREYVTVGGAEG